MYSFYCALEFKCTIIVIKKGWCVMSRGRVKWFNNDKGYGFIEYDGVVNEDVFVHYSAIDQEGYKTLSEGEIVDFTLIETAKGSQAINVKEVKLNAV